MAKGIIVNTGGTGTPPKLIITTFDASKRSSYVPGKELNCASQLKIDVGYLVQGTVADDGTGTLVFTVVNVLDSTPTVITGNTSGNISIGTDQSYIVQNTGQITGNVSVNGGVLLVNGGKASGNVSIADNSTIICTTGSSVGGGTFDVSGTGSNASVAFSGVTVNGKFSTSGIAFVNLGGNNFNGNVSSDKDQYVTIKGNTVGGSNKNLTVSNVVNECNISGNTVSGTTTIDPKCQP